MSAAAAAWLLFFACAAALAGVTSNPRPEIFLEYSSRQAPIDVSRIRIYVDGEDVTAKAVVKTWKVSYVPSEPLSPGVHKVSVLVYDMFGGAGEKNWTFTIDPNANDAKKPIISLAPPSPPNGAMLSSGAGVVFAVNLDGEGAGGVSPESASIIITRNETPAKNLQINTVREEGKLLFTLGELDTARYTVLISVRDKSGNKSNEELTAFTIDSIPPKIEGLQVTPGKAAADEMVTLSANLSDEPEGNLDTLTARIERNGELIKEISSPAVKGENTVRIRARDIEDTLRGKYSFKVSCKDAAGNETAHGETVAVEIEKPDTLLSELARPPIRNNNDFYISHLPRYTRDPSLTITGKAPADAELVLLLNGAPSFTEISEPNGAFTFNGVSLAPGANTIAVAARRAGMETAEETVILDTEPIAEAQPAAPIAEAPPTAPPIEIPPFDEAPDDEPVVVLNPDDGFADQPPAVEPEIEKPPADEPSVEEPPVVEQPEPEPLAEEPQAAPPAAEEPSAEPPAEEQPQAPPPAVEEPEPPAEETEIVINAPKDGHVNRSGRENVNGGGHPNAAVKLFVNGELKAETTSNPGGAFSFKDVELAEGGNKIKVVETFESGEFESETITVTVEKKEKENGKEKK